MARRRNPPDQEEPFSGPCAWCLDEDQDRRHGHYLNFARHEGVKALEEHLIIERTRKYPQREPGPLAEGARAVAQWASGLMTQWQGLVDEHTGAPLRWFEARAQAHRAQLRPVPAPLATRPAVPDVERPTPSRLDPVVPLDDWPEPDPAEFFAEMEDADD